MATIRQFWAGTRPGIKGQGMQESVTLSENLILVCLFEAGICHTNNAGGIAAIRHFKGQSTEQGHDQRCR
jgi:hypothetical protein